MCCAWTIAGRRGVFTQPASGAATAKAGRGTTAWRSDVKSRPSQVSVKPSSLPFPRSSRHHHVPNIARTRHPASIPPHARRLRAPAAPRQSNPTRPSAAHAPLPRRAIRQPAQHKLRAPTLAAPAGLMAPCRSATALVGRDGLVHGLAAPLRREIGAHGP